MKELNDAVTLSREEFEELKKNISQFSDFQRLASLLIWFGIAMVILHIAADIFLHSL